VDSTRFFFNSLSTLFSTGFSLCAFLSKMVFTVVKDAFCAEVSAFARGIKVPGVSFTKKSGFGKAEKALLDIHDMNLHRLQVIVKCEKDDLAGLEAALGSDSAVPSRVARFGSDKNKHFVFITNVKQLGRLLGVNQDTLLALCGGMRLCNTNLTRYAVCGAVVRTEDAQRAQECFCYVRGTAKSRVLI